MSNKFLGLSICGRLRSMGNLAIVLTADFLIICLAYYSAYWVRFDFNIPEEMFSRFLESVAIVLVVKIVFFAFFRLYSGMWRFTSITDLFNILKAITVASGVIVLSLLYVNRFEGFSRSIFVIDWFLTVLFVSAFRIFVRIYYEGRFRIWLSLLAPSLRRDGPRSIWTLRKRLLIIGAGNSGEKIFREIRDNKELNYQVVGFVDDHPSKQGKYIHGKPVIGGTNNLVPIVERVGADEILIAISSATSKQMRRIVSLCKQTGVLYKTIPGIGELISRDVSFQSIRDVYYNDLLGRDNIQLETTSIERMVKDSVVLVTGAGGSIGSELCRQICRFQPNKLILFERVENALYEIDLELKHHFPHLKVIPEMGDIQYPDQLDVVFDRHMPDVVLHAAAYKHVPMMEWHPWKAVKNNIMGTQNLIEVSLAYSVKRFVLVSTDKAVRPTNVMGATKRVAELMVLNQNFEAPTRFMAVRFGNVVGSAGSVIPLFKKQIEEGGPITVTHKDMTRYFMTIPEAAQLILQAGAMGKGGEIFILDMGEPVKIDSLARDFIRLSGLEPDVDIDIEYIGLRPGEKLYEELITEGEGIVPTGHRKIMVLKGENSDLKKLNGSVKLLYEMALGQQNRKIREKLGDVLPEYKPAP